MEESKKLLVEMKNKIDLMLDNISDFNDISSLSKYMNNNFTALIVNFIIDNLKKEFECVELVKSDKVNFVIKILMFNDNYRLYGIAVHENTVFNVVAATKNKNIDKLFENNLIDSNDISKFINTTYLVPDEGKFISYKPLIKMIKEDIEKTKRHIKNFNLKI